MKINSIKMHEYPGRHLSVCLAMLILGATISLFANDVIKVSARVDKSVITIGDRITYSLVIAHDENLKIEQPGPGANLGQFEIKDYTIYDPVKKDGLIEQQFDYEISVFDTGTFKIPPFPVAFAASDTSRDYQIITSEPLEIYVKSVLSAEDQELRDIKAPVNVPFNYRKWILTGILVLIITGSIAGIVYYVRFRKKGIPLFKKETTHPAHEIALEEINRLMELWQEFLKEGKHKLLFTDLSILLRRYLENRFFMKALEETTTEIQQSIDNLELGDPDKQAVMEVLTFCDLVKFAKYIPSEKETINSLERTVKFVHSTKVVFEPDAEDLIQPEKDQTVEHMQPELKS